jgi:hypothetical protein
LLAEGQIDREEVVDWAQRADICEPIENPEWISTLIHDLRDGLGPERSALARAISTLTEAEARVLVKVYELLPTQAAEKRRELRTRPEEYRAWRDHVDFKDLLKQ